MKNNTKYMIILIGALSLITLSALALSGSQDNIKITSTPLQDNAKPVNNDMPYTVIQCITRTTQRHGIK